MTTDQKNHSPIKTDEIIEFDSARKMVDACKNWLGDVGDFITDPTTAPSTPRNIYPTQMLAFEIPKDELVDIMQQPKVVGILGYHKEKHTLSLILVGVDNNYKPSATIKPHQTWPDLNKLNDADYVKAQYLTP